MTILIEKKTENDHNEIETTFVAGEKYNGYLKK